MERNPEPLLREPLQLHDDTQFAAVRIAVFQYSVVILFLFLTSGFYKLQVRNSDYYAEKAQQNRIRSRPLLAPRGRIFDRDGRVIVDNHVSSALLLTRENLKMDDLAPIADGLNLDLAELEETVRHKSREPKYEAIRLKDELSAADLAFINSHRDAFPELDVIQSQPRVYPQEGMMAHVIGYTGEISAAELDSPPFARYKPGDVIGKSGIERQYNATLMGEDGQQRVEVDNRGQVRRAEEEKPVVAGKDLKLTIDLDLQAVAELAMEGKNGAVVALDPRSGEILAMVSRPTFDPNKVIGHISARDWNAINGNPDHPLLNRAIQAQQAPGSTFKPIVALAALETGAISEQTAIHCPGYLTLYDHTYHCMERQGHGTLTVHNAIVHSCDVFFFSVGVKLGIENMAKYAGMVGFGRPTGVDLPGEAAGLVPSPSQKARAQREPWYAGDTPPVAVGQGALTVTPIQLARAIGGIAMGGVWRTPHLVKDDSLAALKTEARFEPAHLQDVIGAMCGVVNEGGTGAPAAIPGIELCGKTGTAQLASIDKTKAEAARHGMNLKENAWFVGFAPRQAPEIVVVALFDHGGVGQYAASIVRDVVKCYFDKKVRLETLRVQRSNLVAGITEGRTIH